MHDHPGPGHPSGCSHPRKDAQGSASPSRDTWAQSRFHIFKETKTSGRLRGFRLGNVFGLRALLALHNFKLDVIPLRKALVTFRLDGAVVDEHVRAVFPADETEALRVIEPFHFTFDSRHVPYSELSKGKRKQRSTPWTIFNGFSILPQREDEKYRPIFFVFPGLLRP